MPCIMFLVDIAGRINQMTDCGHTSLSEV